MVLLICLTVRLTIVNIWSIEVNNQNIMEKTKKKAYVSVAELAKKLGISRVAVFNKIKKGQVPAEKIGRAYAIPFEFVADMLNIDTGPLTDEKKKDIEKTVERVIKEYGETLRLLGKE